MRSETWALVGVAVGAVISGSIQFVHLLIQRRWAVADSGRLHDREREARLFEHRRTAYVEFMENFRRAVDLTNSQLGEDAAPLELSDPVYTELSAAAERVSIYGSESAYDVAQEATFAVGVCWIVGRDRRGSETSPDIAELRRQLTELTEAFRTVARIDLGVEAASHRPQAPSPGLPWPGLEDVSGAEITPTGPSNDLPDRNGDQAQPSANSRGGA